MLIKEITTDPRTKEYAHELVGKLPEPKEYKVRVSEELLEKYPELKECTIVEKPWYKKRGLKTKTGAILTVAGQIITLFNPPIGNIVTGIGALIAGTGIVHGQIKDKKEGEQERGFWAIVRSLLKLLWEYLKGKK